MFPGLVACARDKPGGSASAFEAMAAAHQCLSDGHGASERPAISGCRGRGDLVAEGVGRHADNKRCGGGFRGPGGSGETAEDEQMDDTASEDGEAAAASTSQRRRPPPPPPPAPASGARYRCLCRGVPAAVRPGAGPTPLGHTSAEESLEDEAERRPAPWNQPFELCACVRVRACKRVFCKRENAYPLTPFLSFIPPIVHLRILLSILLRAVCTLCPQPLCPAATFAARRSEREALLARQAQYRENRQQPHGDHRPGGKLQEERERQEQRYCKRSRRGGAAARRAAGAAGAARAARRARGG